ncbi:MAG TPA: cation transporter [Actinomycetota bacterium]|nr:cation transporter [Actinomycetota bacterium]
MEYLTIVWNSLEAMIAVGFGLAARSIALVGFGLDSLVEVFAASVVVWELRGVSEERERRALRLIALSFFALAAYVTVEAVRDLVVRAEASESVPGIVLAAISLIIMPLLALGKNRTGHQMGNQALIADSKETLLCSYLSVVLLVGLLLNATVGWWWADPVAGLGIAYLAGREGLDAWRTEGA